MSEHDRGYAMRMTVIPPTEPDEPLPDIDPRPTEPATEPIPGHPPVPVPDPGDPPREPAPAPVDPPRETP